MVFRRLSRAPEGGWLARPTPTAVFRPCSHGLRAKRGCASVARPVTRGAARTERCQSGRSGRSRKPLYPVRGTVGSNPTLSAIRLFMAGRHPVEISAHRHSAGGRSRQHGGAFLDRPTVRESGAEFTSLHPGRFYLRVFDGRRRGVIPVCACRSRPLGDPLGSTATPGRGAN